MNRKHFLGLFVITAFLLTLSPQAVIGQAGPADDEYVGLAFSTDPDTTDPAGGYDTASGAITVNIYETLLTYDGASTTLIPQLVTEMPTISADAKTFTYSLRDDVFFTDGHQLDAYTVKYSIDRVILHNDDHGVSTLLAEIAGATAYQDVAFSGDPITTADVDAYLAAGGVTVMSEFVVRFKLDVAFVPFMAAMTYQVGSPVSPLAVTSNLDADLIANNATDFVTWDQLFGSDKPSWATGTNSGILPGTRHGWMDLNAVGTGPYKLTDLRLGEGWTMKYNEDWWAPGAGFHDEPTIKTITLTEVAEASTRILALKNGEVDSAGVPLANIGEFYDRDTDTDLVDGIQHQIVKTFSVGYYGFNMNQSIAPGGLGGEDTLVESTDSTYDPSVHKKFSTSATNDAGSNPFTAIKFRQAWSLAFDFDSYQATALSGWQIRMVGAIPDGMFGHVPDLPIPEFDAAAAKAVFEEVGWEGTIKLAYNAGNVGRKIGTELLRDTINGLDVGITVEIIELVWTAYLDAIFGGLLPIFFLGWAPDYADPHNYVFPFLHSKGPLANRQGYSNPAIDAKIDAAGSETDISVREGLYKEIEELALADLPIIYISQGFQPRVFSDRIGNFEGLSTNPMFVSQGFVYADLTTTTTDAGVPGFEFVAVLFGMFAVVTVTLFKRRK